MMLAHEPGISSGRNLRIWSRGMYLYDWDRLSKYWGYEDHERLEDLLRTICRISPERWNYWIQLYDKKRRNGEKGRSSPQLLRRFQRNKRFRSRHRGTPRSWPRC